MTGGGNCGRRGGSGGFCLSDHSNNPVVRYGVHRFPFEGEIQAGREPAAVGLGVDDGRSRKVFDSAVMLASQLPEEILQSKVSSRIAIGNGSQLTLSVWTNAIIEVTMVGI